MASVSQVSVGNERGFVQCTEGFVCCTFSINVCYSYLPDGISSVHVTVACETSVERWGLDTSAFML